MLVLALPVLAEESLNLLVGYTDWFLAGRFLAGNEPIAAMGLLAYFMWMLPSLFSLLSIGALAVIARAIGSGDRRTATQATNQALRVGVALAFIVAGAVLLGAGSFVQSLQLRGRAAELAVRYIWIIAPAIPLIMVEQVASACLRGAGDTVSGLQARVAMNAVNILLSTALVTGYGPFPNLGWDGLAIGTACGHAVAGTILLVLLWRGRSGLKLQNPWRAKSDPSEHAPLFDPLMIRRILRIGVPGAGDVLAVIACHLIYVSIINRLGTLAQAAHGLGVQIEALSYLSGSAFQVAAATLAGQALGAGDHAKAMRGVGVSCLAAVMTMSLAGVLFFIAGPSLAWLFTGDYSETTQLTGHLLGIVAISCPFLAVLQVVSGALRGSGDTSWPLVITFIGLVGVRIPGAMLLAWSEIPLPLTDLVIPGFGLGVSGAWYAMVADVVLRSFLISARFLHGGWRKVAV
jgi:putative MATE family efflux protein